jgi:hypothetical protein
VVLPVADLWAVKAACQAGRNAGKSGDLHKLRELCPQTCPQALVARADFRVMCPKKRQAENLLPREIFPLIGPADYDSLTRRRQGPLNLVPRRDWQD